MINSTLYIFGNLGRGYTQYPFDYTNNILSTFAQHAESKSMLAIHRDRNLMYYCYLRKLDDGHNIGFCVLLNGLMFTNINELFPVFENTITFMVASGGIVGFSSEGELKPETTTFIGKEKYVDASFLYIQSELEKPGITIKKLPPVSYGTSKSEAMDFTATDDNTSIVEASHKYSYTYILKDREPLSSRLSGYKSVISKLNKEKKELAKQHEELEHKYQEMVRQKKQTKSVNTLLLMVIIFGIGLFSLNANLNMTRSQLTDANDSIAQNKENINVQQRQISELADRYNNAVRKREALSEQFSDYMNIVSGYQPFLFKSSSFNFNTNEFTFTYYGLKEGYQNITIRVIYPGGEIYNYNYNVYINIGENTTSLSVNGYFYNTNYYVFELIYDGKTIGGGRH